MTRRVLAIDGPAGSGKSTTARETARRLGWPYLDSGAFYRAAALIALRHRLDLGRSSDRADLRRRLEAAEIRQRMVGGALHVVLDGEDVTHEIRSPAVTHAVSAVASDPDLRRIVNAGIRARVGEGPAVVDGRDIGTAVFPDAFLKVYVEATLAERARRRALETESPERAADPAVLVSYEQSLAGRDRADSERSSAPLSVAPDAVRLDTTHLDVETQVAKVLMLVHAHSLDSPSNERVT
ncbi:MAG TPA: (d)CMP kinase [Gemmatimonadota bacterium]|nr:(d)CMP kinase [Gemmatimonadota bacterium]